MKKFLWLSFIIYNVSFIISAQGVWTQKADLLGSPRYGAVGFSIGNKGYVGTGDNDTISFKDFWEYNPSLNAWAQKADFGGTARRHAVGFSIGSKGYIGTGDDYTAIKRDFWEYDTTLNTWTQIADFGGSGRGKEGNAASFVIGSYAYVGTGNDSTNYFTNDFWKYNPSLNTWSQVAPVPVSLCGAVSFVINGKGYVGTGADTSSGGTSFWEYDPIANVWSQKSTCGGGQRFLAAGFAIGNKGYIGTGADGNVQKRDFWEYDLGTNTWTQKTNFSGVPRSGAVGFSIGSKGYIGTGLDSLYGYKNDFWEFDPNGNGVNEIDLENLISVYPNPSVDGKFTVSSLQFTVNSIDIYNASGKHVYHSTVNSKQETVNLSEASGIYFLQIKTERGNVTKKIIISR